MLYLLIHDTSDIHWDIIMNTMKNNGYIKDWYNNKNFDILALYSALEVGELNDKLFECGLAKDEKYLYVLTQITNNDTRGYTDKHFWTFLRTCTTNEQSLETVKNENPQQCKREAL